MKKGPIPAWLNEATGNSPLRVGPSPLHSPHDRLFKCFVMTKEPDIKNQTKLWYDFSGLLTMWSTLFSDSGMYPTNHPEMGSQTHYSSRLV